MEVRLYRMSIHLHHFTGTIVEIDRSTGEFALQQTPLHTLDSITQLVDSPQHERRIGQLIIFHRFKGPRKEDVVLITTLLDKRSRALDPILTIHDSYRPYLH